MSDQRGVFTLRTIYLLRKKEQWVDLETVWHSPSPSPISDTGYFGGGAVLVPTLSSVLTMDKVTYSSDTTAAVPSANLSFARRFVGATGSQTHGYFGGGTTTPGSVTASMNKVTYLSDTTAAVPGANLSMARNLLAATGNSDAGYFGGGAVPDGNVTDKTTYSSDTTAALPSSANLSPARYGIAATGNTTDGYFGGGWSPSGYYSIMQKVIYSSDTSTAVPTANLSAPRRYLAATGNSTDGYFGGCLLYTSPSPRDMRRSRMPSSA